MIKVADFVRAYDGDVLFSLKEEVTVGSESIKSTVISFKNAEINALKAELQNREVKSFTVISNIETGISKKVVKTRIDVVLGEMVEDDAPETGENQTPGENGGEQTGGNQNENDERQNQGGGSTNNDPTNDPTNNDPTNNDSTNNDPTQGGNVNEPSGTE